MVVTEVHVAEGGAAAVTANSSPMAATSINDLHPDILSLTLPLLDGPALAAASSVNSQLRSLASDQALWLNVCLATWPSLRSHPELLHQIIPRSFFSDAFPSPSFSSFSVTVAAWKQASFPSKLISVIDLWYKDVPIFSRVVETDTSNPCFRGSTLRIDALHRNEYYDSLPPLAPGISPEDLSLTWVVVDPNSRRAVNLSTRRPVRVDRHGFTGHVVARFPAVIGGGSAAIGAAIGYVEGSGQLWSFALMGESKDGEFLTLQGLLAVITAAMRGVRRRREGEAEEKRRWQKFVVVRKRRQAAGGGAGKVGRLGLRGCGSGGVLGLYDILDIQMTRPRFKWFEYLFGIS